MGGGGGGGGSAKFQLMILMGGNGRGSRGAWGAGTHSCSYKLNIGTVSQDLTLQLAGRKRSCYAQHTSLMICHCCAIAMAIQMQAAIAHLAILRNGAICKMLTMRMTQTARVT